MARLSSTMVTAIPFLRLRDGTHPLAAGPGTPASCTGRADRDGTAGRCHKNLGPGRRIVSKTAREGVSRFGGQAGTQASDPTPAPGQNPASRAAVRGLSTSSLPTMRELRPIAMDRRLNADHGVMSTRSRPPKRLREMTVGRIAPKVEPTVYRPSQ